MQGKGDTVLALSGNGKALLIKADLTAVQDYVLATAYGVALAIGPTNISWSLPLTGTLIEWMVAPQSIMVTLILWALVSSTSFGFWAKISLIYSTPRAGGLLLKKTFGARGGLNPLTYSKTL